MCCISQVPRERRSSTAKPEVEHPDQDHSKRYQFLVLCVCLSPFPPKLLKERYLVCTRNGKGAHRVVESWDPNCFSLPSVCFLSTCLMICLAKAAFLKFGHHLVTQVSLPKAHRGDWWPFCFCMWFPQLCTGNVDVGQQQCCSLMHGLVGRDFRVLGI